MKNKLSYQKAKDIFFNYIVGGCIGIEFLIALLVYLVAILYIPTQNGDNIEHIHSSFLVANGNIPYKDFFQHHNPLMWYLFAPLVKVFEYNTVIIEIVCFISFLIFLKSLVYVYKINVEFLNNKFYGWIACLLIFVPLQKLYAIDFRPDNFMIFALMGGIYYYFKYLRDKKWQELSIAGIWFLISFLFAQKAVFPLAVIGATGVWFLYKKEIKLNDFYKAMIAPLCGALAFLFYLYYYDMIGLYYKANYTFNLELVKGFELNKIIELSLYFKIIIIGGVCGVIYALFSKNVYLKIIGILFISELLQRRLYFSPFAYYYWLLIYLGAMMFAGVLSKLDEKNRLIRVCIVIMVSYFLANAVSFQGKNVLKKRDVVYLPDFISTQINRCDYVFNGDGLMYNLFGKDPHYYWQLIGQLDVVGEKVGIYPKPNMNELILKYKPKVLFGNNYFNKFSEESGRHEIVHYIDKNIINTYYEASNYGDVGVLKKEYRKDKCVKNQNTGEWEYID